MISLNEAHNMQEVLENLAGWAAEVYLLDSYSSDKTVDIALSHGVHVVQRAFRGFGDQWNYALTNLPISAPWTMKMDPDERLTDDLKYEIEHAIAERDAEIYSIPIRLHFMGARLPSVLHMNRLWKTGTASFSNVAANEHALSSGLHGKLVKELIHLDSPSLDHWVTKQNGYTTAEAISQFQGKALTTPPKLFGTALERRMWIKKFFWSFPGRYTILFLYHLLIIGAWRAGKVGWIWSHLRTEVYRQWEYKHYEFSRRGYIPAKVPLHTGQPDDRVDQSI
jgi:glycosyltransferase involved in cell wall biosynthesis